MELLTLILAAVEAQNTRIATLTEQQRKLAEFVKVMDEETPRRLERIFVSVRWVAGLVETWKGRGMPKWRHWRKG